ncbi:hypothetical protein H7344_17150 [Nocardioides deserti]|uniref:PKD domain-containing protein n=1 Tax=Nocardioides deserti TaxID=1588644 RepID=A0ABR6UC55_9ACTN|nr:hypothetical protein [Nocardioides deserti]GGO78813.1 hypothetical protein GCM10012276_37070 [Nocardioides deserti]
MNKRRTALVSAGALLLSISASATAVADEPSGPVEVGTTTGGLWTNIETTTPSAQTGGSDSDAAQTVSLGAQVDVGTALAEGFCAGTNWNVECVPEVEEPSAPQLTPGMVANAFRRLPLPGATLQVQPPNGRTLVNFATNFYTERGDLTRSVTLLGRRVDLRITATGYTWHFGDGTTTTTTEPGAPYPALDVTHDYRKAGRVAPSVDTTYSAEFSVDGGPWRPVSGTVTIPGPPTALRVLTATPTLVGHR